MLVMCNGTRSLLPAHAMTTSTLPTTLNELLRSQASSRSGNIAYVFLSGPPDEERKASISYAELDVAASRVAALLHAHAIGEGERVLLLCLPGLDYVEAFLGCLYAGAVAVPVFPPRNRQHAARIAAIIESAGAKAILCTSDEVARCEKLLQVTNAPPIALVDLGGARSMSAACALADVPPGQIAFLQYTSGTTGKPKGVMVTHGNLMHNLGLINLWLESDERSTMVSWLPPYHDMGLIGGILAPLYGGYRSVLMAPERFVQHPYLWLRAVSEYRADITGAPDFAYRVCLRRISDEQLATLDLSCVKTAYSGAEQVRSKTLSEFARRFCAARFDATSLTPCYGLAEATLLVSGRVKPSPLRMLAAERAALEHRRLVIRREIEGLPLDDSERDDERELVSVGAPIGAQQVLVRDAQTGEPCADGAIGEICVAGKSVAPGYWQQYEQTIATFQRGVASHADPLFMGTGDLGFFHRGELYVAGRLKDMIIIGGRNCYSEDIEQTALGAQPALVPNGCAAFGVELDEQEQLVVVAEVERTQRKGNLDAVLKTIREAIWRRHDISPAAVLLVLAGHVPKTSSGKVRRSECRTRLRNGELTILAQWGADVFATRKASASSLSQRSAISNAANAAGAASTRQDNACIADELNEWLRHYARTRIDSRTIDERRTIPPHIVLDSGNRGLLGMQIGREHGGLGLCLRDMLRVVSQLAAIDLTLAFFVGLNNTLGIRPILLHGQPALRDELLPLLATGRMLAAFALTEPIAGSNPHAIAATARRVDGNAWLVNGQKSWSGSSAWAGVINVFAKQADGSGTVALAMRQGTHGLQIGAEDLTMGVRGMIQNTLHLHDARVSDACRLGEPGHGMEIAQETMNFARLGIGAIGVGGMKRCAHLMHRYSRRRNIGTGLLLANPLTRLRLGEMRHRIDALHALVEQLAGELDEGRAAPRDGLLIAKILGSEFLSQSTDELMQTLGGRGYIETNLVPQMYRDARLARIFEGPTETLLSHLGSRLLNRCDDLLKHMEERIEAGMPAAELREIAEQLREDSLQSSEVLGGATHAAHWANYWLGTAAQWAFLLAVVEHASRRRRVDEGALEWVRSHYENAIEQAQRQARRRCALASVDALDEWALTVARDIGSIERTVPAAASELDPMLCDALAHTAAPHNPAGAEHLPSAGTATPLASIDPPSRQKLEEWLLAWLRTRMRHRPLDLSVQTSFADIGLDSIASIELTMAFSDAFGMSVDASAIWDYPTIGALATHLASRMDQKHAR